MQIFYNTSDATLNRTLCGHNLPGSILSEANRMRLELHTDDSMSYGGYEALYYTVSVENYGRRKRN